MVGNRIIEHTKGSCTLDLFKNLLKRENSDLLTVVIPRDQSTFSYGHQVKGEMY